MTPTWAEMWRVFGRIGLLSFGGPAAQIGLMHRELVDERAWLTEAEYLRALSFCMLLPGPEAMQLATYAGWRLRGLPGGLLAGLLFVGPGALLIAALALAYGTYGNLPLVAALFVGVQATVIVIVIGALRKVAAKALKGPVAWAIAAGAFAALFALHLPYPAVIAAAALAGALALPRPAATPAPPGRGSWRQTTAVLALGGVLWAAPLVLAAAAGHSFLTDIGLFFSRLAVVTFGGAYAVLAYMTQTVVQDYGWITTPQMMDALGLAETTPGPLILVTQFVAMLAGLAQGGAALALAAGAMALWVTFVPCFIWIFAFAPLIDWLAGQARLQAALSGITAAVVGVIASLSLWFATQVLFGSVGTARLGPVALPAPDLATLDLPALVLTLVAAWLMFARGWPLLRVLATCTALALLGHLAGVV